MNSLIEISNVSFSYDGKINVLENINLNIEENSYYGIYGHSGSGKSTLLFLIGNLLNPDLGKIEYRFSNIKKNTGFVFQFFNLINELTILENAKLAQYIRNKKENLKEIKQFAEILGISELLNKFPTELSGGEKQRASILRAVVGNVKIILADEPTGSLDMKNKIIVFKLFRDLIKFNKTVIVVSHEKELMDFCDNKILLEDGKIKGES
ncbi:lipoprotein-releasing system ATP-binding protein [Marinitoga hydrogenitolerans DSM 16785]|uniref:Lipoprotein-releasing system ATP-binding protein n=1 Tax=Marinitoga hydrogenitolerans (strain DSM 16785 / JCM 12826 / AT1271) TaxID=1122195 RepID=A0A1M4X2F0_MARH1|nr:ATP-binding cassette domain-containing protein [Marinitoga hydrogenitolerans]SHE87382.1 lipoprotein-releasing system ATP-binding protein [Marinitoga hydrogenitolerans DSM 16785]